ncbi:MAG TPA: GYF domain-containing protein [Polyangia bacterium]
MKIVCEACQAKYSIADEKVRGKVFKIRCKKCSHVIVVRGTGEAGGASGEFASSPSSAPDLALDAGWHIVVEGEQVGPLSEGDVKSRLVRGEITPDTYIWTEGLPDWVKISTLPEFASEGGEAGGPFGAGAGAAGGLFTDQSTTVNAPSADAFAAAQMSNGPAAGDLFAAPTRAPAESAPASLGSMGSSGGGGGGGGAFAGFEASLPAASGGQAGGFTGQRHENSVLFSLSNLEALAKPSAPLPSPARGTPSASSNSEGSGLIDIRAMANMTLGGQTARADQQKGPDLPAYSAPQFSPVAPMLLTPVSSTPKWLIGLLAGFGGIFVILAVIVTVKMFSKPDPVPPPIVSSPEPGTVRPARTPAPGTTVAAAPAAGTAAPPATTPPPPNEALPPRETPPKAEPAERPVASNRPARATTSRRQAPRGNDEVNNRLAGAFTTPPPKPAAEAPRKPKDDIEALLEAAAGGGRKAAAPARREDDEPARGAERLPPLSREEIVKGMNGVLPKARECYAQFKVPGVANAKITVGGNGRVSGVNVSGKFAGTPSGNCVESAIKSARFAPSAGLTFDYPVPLR